MTQSNTPAHHYLLTSATQWCSTGKSFTLTEAIRHMEKEKLTYVIWYVPLAPSEEYEIALFAPRVSGAYAVEMVEFKQGKRVARKEGEKK